MEIIDGIRVFKSPSAFFKWLWNYNEDIIITESGCVYKDKELIAKLNFTKKRRGSRN